MPLKSVYPLENPNPKLALEKLIKRGSECSDSPVKMTEVLVVPSQSVKCINHIA